MIRTKGEPGTGNIVEAVRHMKLINRQIGELARMKRNEKMLEERAKEYGVPLELVKRTADLGRLPVVNFAAGGIATPADAALMMGLGADGVFVGSGIFKSRQPERFARAIVRATRNYDKPEEVAKACEGLGDAMKGKDVRTLAGHERMQERGK